MRMQPRELPNLTVANRPTMGPDSGVHYGQRGVLWLVACSLGLLVAAGVTFSLVAQPTDEAAKPKTAVVQPRDRDLAPKIKPTPAMASRSNRVSMAVSGAVSGAPSGAPSVEIRSQE